MAKILLIEDNLEIRENTAELLELSGYEVITAANGRDGIDHARKHKPSLILSDIRMPGPDGYELLREIRNAPETVRTPFVFISASAEKSEMETGLRMGANAYIIKPFEEEELLAVVARFLPRKEQH